MVYVSGGQILESRSPWRLSYIPEIFWGFRTLVNPSHSNKGSKYTADYRVSGRGPDPFGPGGGPRRRMGGFRGGGGGPSPPPMAGGG
ncbi:hypothetical protein LSH36_403g01011 [Paralvinella palmiformis]|uniref:Selenoprotein K n=1 Tax=Paralvinella palmiformis TaxID=53620 RepID=A0AAD9JCS6_9ANNE|nr:hypothetical protein LSH36_403g01011 [Paralvinella palmiformis]